MNERLRQYLKEALLLLCWLLQKRGQKRNAVPVLMYHSFDSQGWRYGVDPKMLRRQLTYLAKQYTFVTLGDVIEFAAGKKKLETNSVSITVDDGYLDTYQVFFPIAKEMNIPFTLFLTTDLSVKNFFGNLQRPNWSQLKEMQESGLVTFGQHGHTHINFIQAYNDGTLESELEMSEDLFKSKLHVEPFFAAYPSGRYDLGVKEFLKNRGYRAVLSTRSGFIKEGDDLFALKRVEVSRHMSLRMFKLRLTRALLLYNLVLKKFK